MAGYVGLYSQMIFSEKVDTNSSTSFQVSSLLQFPQAMLQKIMKRLQRILFCQRGLVFDDTLRHCKAWRCLDFRLQMWIRSSRGHVWVNNNIQKGGRKEYITTLFIHCFLQILFFSLLLKYKVRRLFGALLCTYPYYMILFILLLHYKLQTQPLSLPFMQPRQVSNFCVLPEHSAHTSTVTHTYKIVLKLSVHRSVSSTLLRTP